MKRHAVVKNNSNMMTLRLSFALLPYSSREIIVLFIMEPFNKIVQLQAKNKEGIIKCN